jgi:hypothetical protein
MLALRIQTFGSVIDSHVTCVHAWDNLYRAVSDVG